MRSTLSQPVLPTLAPVSTSATLSSSKTSASHRLRRWPGLASNDGFIRLIRFIA